MSFNAISAALCSASRQSREIDAPVFCHPLTAYGYYQYPLWTQWISLSKLTQPDWFWPFCTFSTPTFCLLTQRCPAQALWPHSFGRQWIWTWSCFRQSFTPTVFSQPLLPFPYAGKSGPWESCLLTPTNHDATLVKPADMTNKCPAPTKELLLDTGNWSCCKCRPQNSGGFAVPSKSIYTIFFPKKKMVYQHSNIQKSDILPGVYLNDWGWHGLAFLHKSANDSPDSRLKDANRWPKVHSQLLESF